MQQLVLQIKNIVMKRLLRSNEKSSNAVSIASEKSLSCNYKYNS